MLKTWMKLLALLAAISMFAVACGSDDTTDAGSDSDTGSSSEPADSDADDDAMEDEDHSDDDGAMEDDAMEDDGAMAEAFNVGLTYDIGGRGDQSFNDSAAAGIDAAEAELGITFSEAEPNADGSNRAELLQLQADQSALVIGVGFLFAGDVAAVAAENPGVNFAVVDDAMLDFDNGGVPIGENIAGLTFAEEQGSYLVGVAAALKSETGTVGFIGGVSGFGLIEKFEAGFAAGVASVDPDIEIISQYITEFPDFDGFNAPDRAQETATAMYSQGADIIYHAAGGSGAGLFEAAKATSESTGTKVWGIGVDSDQYNTVSPEVQEYVLTSMLKRVDSAVLEITRAHADGSFGPGNTVYDLSTDGVGYATSGGFVDDIVDQLEAAKADIVSGAVTVPTEP
jgi:basic membrane protein A